MPGWISPWEIALVLIAALLLFGGKRLPEMGKQLGTGMREFKNSITGKDEEDAAPAEIPAETEPKEPVSASSERDS